MTIEGIRFLDHPADIGIEARGPACATAFERAAAAMISLIVDPATVCTTEFKFVTLHASDAGQLLVRWLSEILYLFDGAGFVAHEFTIRTCTSGSLEATVGGEPFDERRHRPRGGVKAVTYHQLAVWEDAQGWCVRVFLDI